MPNVASWQKDDSSLSASEVISRLKAMGIPAIRTKEFNGRPQGRFLGVKGISAGERVRSTSRVIVRESKGPGVPKGTVGRKATAVVSLLKGMGVPVHYKKIVIGADDKASEGTVVLTSPADGKAVTDKSSGIWVGVASKSDGVPYSAVGMDKDSLTSALEKAGHKVTLKPRFSSKGLVDKATDTQPSPGSELKAGQSVTVYYGVDSSQTKKLLTESYGDAGQALGLPGDFMVGRYCRASGDDCIELTMETKTDAQGPTTTHLYEKSDAHDWTRYLTDTLDWQNGMPTPPTQKSVEHANMLVYGDSGAFEIMPWQSTNYFRCGGSEEPVDGLGLGTTCSGGKMVTGDGSTTLSGASFVMDRYYTYFPAGADVSAVEKSGYFDKTAISEASSQKSVDSTRPFIIVRDPSKYSSTTYTITAGAVDNPFLPAWTDTSSQVTHVAMKPAPSDSTAYYLVEDSGTPDWTSLPDAQVKGASDGGKTDGSSGGSSSSPTSGSSSISPTAGSSSGSSSSSSTSKVSASKQFAAFAGKYLSAPATDGDHVARINLSRDGSFTGTVSERILDINGETDLDGTFSGRFTSLEATGQHQYTAVCDASVFTVTGDSDLVTGFEPCSRVTFYAPGTQAADVESFSDILSIAGITAPSVLTHPVISSQSYDKEDAWDRAVSVFLSQDYYPND